MTIAGLQFPDTTRATVEQFEVIAAWYSKHCGAFSVPRGTIWKKNREHGVHERARRARCKCGAVLIVEEEK